MFKKIAVAATLAILSSAAFAADAQMYAGADVGRTKIDGFSDRETSYGAFLGYQFNPNVGIEAGYRRLADFTVSNTNVTLDQVALSVVGTMPLSSGFSVFGRLGYNHITATGNSTAATSGGLYGIGMGYDFTPTVTARLEVQKPSSDSSNFSAGVSFKF